MPAQFKPHGPFEIPVQRLPGGRNISPGSVTNFWSEHRELSAARGCYLFAMRAGAGVIPGYVGKACKSFIQECFTPDKIGKYLQFAARYARGTPVLFFLTAPSGRGRPNERAIDDCEQELITLAYRVSSNLMNVQGTSGPSFIIPHITEGTRGRRSAATIALLRALMLDEPMKRMTNQDSAIESPVDNLSEANLGTAEFVDARKD